MKKFYAIFIAVIMIMSVCSVFAKTGLSGKSEKSVQLEDTAFEPEVTETGKTSDDVPLVVTPAPIAEKTRLTAKTRLQNLEKAREVLKEKLTIAKNRYVDAKQKYIDLKQKYSDSREKLKETKQRLRERCQDENSVECGEVQREIKANSIDYLTKTSDKLLNLIEKIKSKVESSEDLTDEQANKIISELDAETEKVNKIKESISKLTEESAKEDIKAVAQDLKNEWKVIKNVLKRGVGILINSRMSFVIQKSENLGKRLEAVITKLGEKGTDTAKLDELIEQFKLKIAEAKKNYELAKEKYSQQTSAGNVDEVMKEANGYMKEAHKQLKEAHEILKEILKEIRLQKGGQQILEQTQEQTQTQEHATVQQQEQTREQSQEQATEQIQEQESTETENTETNGATGSATASDDDYYELIKKLNKEKGIE